MSRILLAGLLLALTGPVCAAETPEAKTSAPADARFHPVKAPDAGGLMLKPGDRLAICGDSITEQKMYSRIVETYLTVCVPDLGITVRQFGWSGERAPGFLTRMTNDCLRFQPTIATTCYGMNDHEYRPYEERIGRQYRESSTSIIETFKAHGARVVLGSPGCVGRMPGWVKSASGTVEDLNLSLCELRNAGIGIAAAEQAGFADVFWPMFTAGFAGREKYGADYAIAGKDGVHPGWAGQLVMAYAFLKSFGLDGEIGTFTVDEQRKEAAISGGHELIHYQDGELKIRSRRYPFCATGELNSDNSIRSGMTLVPFNQDLNRLILVVRNGAAPKYKVTWGGQSRSYSAEQLAQGVNLADEFITNPFTEAFQKVDAAVAAKQAYETRQIKDLFHGPEGRADLEATAALTEKTRAPLAAAVRTSLTPVDHSLRVEPE